MTDIIRHNNGSKIPTGSKILQESRLKFRMFMFVGKSKIIKIDRPLVIRTNSIWDNSLIMNYFQRFFRWELGINLDKKMTGNLNLFNKL